MKLRLKLPRFSAYFWKKNKRDWPVVMHLFVFSFPVIVCFIIIFSAVSYYRLNAIYTQSLSLAPQIETRMLALRLEEQLEKLRDALVALSAKQQDTSEGFHDDVMQILKPYKDFIVEVGYKKHNGESAILLRNANGFREVGRLDVSQGPYSPLQQITTISLKPNAVSLLPAVQVFYPNFPNNNKMEEFSVMRMALATNDGVFVVGIDLQALQRLLAGYMAMSLNDADETDKNEFRFAYFFDYNGWILFEMSTIANPDMGSSAAESQVDVARRGFTGDLGRAGLSNSFRPWAVHEDFWYMVKSIQGDKAGSLSATARYYSSEHANAFAKLYFTPVRFAGGSSQGIVGGLAFLSTAVAPQMAFNNFIQLTLWGILALLFCGMYMWFMVQNNVGVPLRELAKEIKNMLAFQDFSSIGQRPKFEEHQMLITAANGLIAQGMSMQTALSRVEGEVHHARAKQPVDLLQAIAIPDHGVVAEYGIVGSSAAILEVRQQIKRAAKAGTDVLVWGETGTGKELVTEAIHKSSSRSSDPLISINCGALDENLLLDVLFGHVKGAFTGAKDERKGAFLAADGGTLHLDEIGTASLKVQQALLRALSVRRIRPLGTDMEYPFDTRVIAATNLDLRESVKQGPFREDLYYRLAIITIKTPALRHRKEDIPELAAFCIQDSAARLGKPHVRLSRGALDALLSYDWPGNVREFQNCMLRAIAFAESDILLPKHIIYTEGDIAHLNMAGRTYISGDVASNTQDWASSPGLVGPQKNIPAGLNDRQALAWKYILKNKKITRVEYQRVVGGDISSRTAQHDLRELVKLGLVSLEGAGPGTYYALCKE